MPARFDGKVALVAGGDDAIGRAGALAFARQGATVVVAGPDARPLDATVATIRRAGGRAERVVADVTRGGPEAAERMVAVAVERCGGLDIAFNNVTVTGPARPVAETCETVWTELLAHNLTGVWTSMKHEIAYMKEHHGGVIVNTACNLLSNGLRPGLGAYAASKAALTTLTRAAAGEYLSAGIRINAISPGPVDGPTAGPGPAGPGPATADEIADSVVWLCSDESSYVVGHDLVLDRKRAA
ncbi:SDR family NAD(P)-dependent oxidoreductase [Streptomyces sp. NPDC001633]|uniref:SDR family NAD(P)-dependent oxidoreductase n=1 Tax=Streptomyces sp. NPDC001633 TaxID=3364595 RepID=UPI0036A3827B